MPARTLPHVVSPRKCSPQTPVAVSQFELRGFLVLLVENYRLEASLKRIEAGLAKRLRAGAPIRPGKFTARLLRRRGRIFVDVL